VPFGEAESVTEELAEYVVQSARQGNKAGLLNDITEPV